MVRHTLVATLWLCPALAAAQASDIKAAADALFDEGRRLLTAGDLDHACPKFEASLQLLDQLGVRVNLADCHARQGRTATAWAEFREVASSQSDKRGGARVAYARRRIKELEPRLVRLQISVESANQLPGLTVRRDGTPVPREAFGTPLPVDPGSYTIDALAPDYLAWSTHIEVKKSGQVVTIEIPRLAPVPAKVAPQKLLVPNDKRDRDEKTQEKAATTDDNVRHRRHLIGLSVSAGGAVAVGVGVALGLEARSKWGSAGMHCDANHICDAMGVSINHDARLLGNVGTIVGGFGLAALLTGTALYVMAPAARPVIEHAHLDVDENSNVRIGFAGRF